MTGWFAQPVLHVSSGEASVRVLTRLFCSTLVLAVATATMACGDHPTKPSGSAPPLTEVTTSTHYVVHTASGDSVDAAWQDAFHEWLLRAPQIDSSRRLDYYKDRDRAHLEALTGHANTNGFSDAGTTRFHTIWPTENHENVHALVILEMGFPPSLFTEGIAVAHSTDPPRGILTPRWSRTDIDVLAKGYDAAGRLPALSSLLRTADFARIDANITYPCAGSFVHYLIATQAFWEEWRVRIR